MRIGIDFDNTIVSYDDLFHLIATEKKLIPSNIDKNKLSVRNYLRSTGREDEWTRMQGEVYGLRMSEAKIYPGALEFMFAARSQGHELFIISHKTKTPFMGPPYDLHEAAQAWVSSNLRCSNEFLFDAGHLFYELTKEAKIDRISEVGCDIFIDDLPEILAMDSFPINTRKILFDADGHHQGSAFENISSWNELGPLVF